MKHIKLALLGFLAIATIGILPSCRRPYDVPEFVEIKPNETAFVIPLEGDTSKQAKFQSQDFVSQCKVANKRIQIPHRWQATGRFENTEGTYLPTVSVITVNRQPSSRTWGAKGSGSNKDQNDSISVESRDSVGFTVGWTCTAQVLEEDTATFLYRYAGATLSAVMDNEVHDRVQSRCAEFAAKFDLDVLRAKKSDMLTYVRDGDAENAKLDLTNPDQAAKAGVIAYFKSKGITITNLGMFEGFTYEDKQVQAAIDEVFTAQQQKQVAAAERDAQEKKNETIKLAANAAAEKARIEAEGKAKAIELETAALNKAQTNPLYAQKLLLERWDGKFPTFFSGGQGTSPTLLLQVPGMTPAAH